MLIGITGLKGSGKDTVARFLADLAPGFEIRHWAGALKLATSRLFDFPDHHVQYFRDSARIELNYDIDVLRGRSVYLTMDGRTFLQRLGTDVGRELFGENFWVDLLMSQYGEEDELWLRPDRGWIIADTRFDNEAQAIKDRGGMVWEVKRPGLVSDGHASEAGIQDDLVDYTIYNNGSLDDLFAHVLTLWNHLQVDSD